MTVLHVFDMDGTLLRGTSASLELARHGGADDVVHDLERLSAAGRLANVEFHRRTHPLWQNLTPQLIDVAFEQAPWISHLRTVWDDIARRGETAIVISMSPLFFVQRLSRWGAGQVFASDNRIGAPFDETLILEEGGFSREQVVAYGDSYTDVPLFRTGLHSVSVNATPALERLASRRYCGEDLRGAYRLARSLVD